MDIWVSPLASDWLLPGALDGLWVSLSPDSGGCLVLNVRRERTDRFTEAIITVWTLSEAGSLHTLTTF